MTDQETIAAVRAKLSGSYVTVRWYPYDRVTFRVEYMMDDIWHRWSRHTTVEGAIAEGLARAEAWKMVFIQPDL